MSSAIVEDLFKWDRELREQAPDVPISMLVGVYVGLLIGQHRSKEARELRAEIESDMGDALGIPPEALEAHFRQLVEPRG